MSRTPGANPASKTPTMVRSATNWPNVCTSDIQQVAMPHKVMMTGRKIEGLDLERSKFDGTSKSTYVMTGVLLAMCRDEPVLLVRTENYQRDGIFAGVHVEIVSHARDLCIANIRSLRETSVQVFLGYHIRTSLTSMYDSKYIILMQLRTIVSVRSTCRGKLLTR